MMHISVWILVKLLFMVAIACPDAASGQNYDNCVTPNKEPGSCIPLDKCTPLYTKLQTNSVTEADRIFLGQSQCGYRDTVLICCAKRYLTSNMDVPVITDRISSNQGNWLPKEPNCPIDFGDRILGGTETDLDEFPWMAMIEYTKPGNVKGHHCGGALINNYYVLTAAHCISKVTPGWRLTAVRLGEWDTSTNPDCDKGVCAPSHVDIEVEQTIVHPQYAPNSKGQFHDIALLRLARPVQFTQYIAAICLPDTADLRNAPFTSYGMDACGWGATETGLPSKRKLKAGLNVIDLAQCQRTYATQRVSLESSQMCAGGKQGIDSCRGDSGGPLIHRQSGNVAAYYYLVGVVSFGPTPCGLQGWPGVYTRVGPYVNWIKSTIKA